MANLIPEAFGFFENLWSRFRLDNEERRREDRETEAIMDSNLSLQSPPIGTTTSNVSVLSASLYPKENALRHKCEKYELVTRGKGTAVIRRGGTFKMGVEFSQEIDLKNEHTLIIYLNFGSQPIIIKGTQAILIVSGNATFQKNPDFWDCRLVGDEDGTTLIEIQVPETVPVGIWTMKIEIKQKTDPTSSLHSYQLDEMLYILFNPWCKDDDVYLADETKRNEYVLSDVGKIWVGAYPTARGREWVYGQFDDVVLPACMMLLERSGLNPEQRGNPVMVSRAISRIVNSNDDTGLVVGKWTGNYEDGTPPSAWSGSIRILELYMETKQSVKYGQCWVFSGLTTTICRAIGIPCRSVSNLNSAHDTNLSLSIDKYYDEKGNEYGPSSGVVPPGFSDSVWNFHVWNDVWMRRPDLPSGYGGWQTIDATPQEQSHGMYQCGPASLEAVRRGLTNFQYDVGFVLAEVNADLIHWQRDTTAVAGFKKLSSNDTHIGRLLLTKKPGEMENDAENCTEEYKPPEGTRAERIVLYAAAARTLAAREAYLVPSVVEEDVKFALEDVERVPIGSDFTITVKAKNTSNSVRSLCVTLASFSEYYTGIKANNIKSAEWNFQLEAGSEETLQLTITYNEYYDKLVEYAMIKLVAIAKVVETSQTWIDEDTFQILKPAIKIEVLDNAEIEKPLPIKFSLINPLNVVLRNVQLVVDGPGLTRPKIIQIPDVPAKEEMIYKMNVYPKYTGSRSLIVTFNSKELVDITGSTSVNILG